MKHKKSAPLPLARSAAVMVALSAAALPPQAQAATDVLSIEAIIAPTGQAILATQDLNFGVLVQPNAGATVVIPPIGAPVLTGVNAAGGTITPGQIRTFGSIGDSVEYSIPGTAVISNGSTTMIVDQFNIGTNAGGLNYTEALPAATQIIPIGGRLNVGANQPEGTYTGTVTITADFN